MATSHKKSGPSQSDRKEKDRILIASGVNLDILGIREPQIYGRKTLVDMQKLVSSHWPRIAEQHQLSHLNLEFFQSNDEAVFLGHISKGWRGIVLNPGAWTHTSVALADRLIGVGVPFVEVHLAQLHQREEFRQKSFCARHALGIIQGFGIYSYVLGLEGLALKIAGAAT